MNNRLIEMDLPIGCSSRNRSVKPYTDVALMIEDIKELCSKYNYRCEVLSTINPEKGFIGFTVCIEDENLIKHFDFNIHIDDFNRCKPLPVHLSRVFSDRCKVAQELQDGTFI